MIGCEQVCQALNDNAQEIADLRARLIKEAERANKLAHEAAIAGANENTTQLKLDEALDELAGLRRLYETRTRTAEFLSRERDAIGNELERLMLQNLQSIQNETVAIERAEEAECKLKDAERKIERLTWLDLGLSTIYYRQSSAEYGTPYLVRMCRHCKRIFGDSSDGQCHDLHCVAEAKEESEAEEK